MIRRVLESKYNSLKDEESPLDPAVEPEVATSAPTALADRRISQLDAEIAALRFFSSRGLWERCSFISWRPRWRSWWFFQHTSPFSATVWGCPC